MYEQTCVDYIIIMRKVFFVACWLLALSVSAGAQGYDTISPGSRMPGYHYSWWYDTMPVYYDTDRFNGYAMNRLRMWTHQYENYYLVLHSEYVEHPAAITGVGVWVVDETMIPEEECHVHYTWKNNDSPMPEYVHVFQYDAQRDTPYCLVGSIRWDTASPKVLKIPQGEDTNRWGFHYCYLYEARTSNPIFVDSTFFLAGSFNNNIQDSTYMMDYIYKPVAYGFVLWNVGGMNMGGIQHVTPQRVLFHNTVSNLWWPLERACDEFGGFLAMIDYARVDVRPNDYEMGEAGPSGDLSMWRDQTIWA